jgi:hypothetical protein
MKHPKYKVPDDYLKNFMKADLTFQHQLVYDRERREAVHLTPIPHDFPLESTDFLGT